MSNKFYGKRKKGFDKKNNSDKDGRNGWMIEKREERHPGSYPLEELKSSPIFEQRIIQDESKSLKRKYAVCISYLGTNYQGLQINPGAKTIEAELERALFLAGAMIEMNYGFMQKVQWSRAARTDRGVHALTQCCAMKLIFPVNERETFIQQVNSFLPSEIRVQGLTKVSKTFNAHAQCTKREYHYLLPTFVLQNHKVVNDLLEKAYSEQGPVVGAGYEGGYVDPSTSRSLGCEFLQKVRPDLINYRVNTETLELLRNALKQYEGTRSYHNFTTGKDATEANSKRFIISFTCGEPFIASTGVEWVLLSVVGQSFLLNQIRNMVGLAVDICRGKATESDQLACFTESKVNIPMAPALGLYLNDIFFEGYNNKQNIERSLDATTRANKNKSKQEEGENLEEEKEEEKEEEEAKDLDLSPSAKRVKIDSEDAIKEKDEGEQGEDQVRICFYFSIVQFIY